MAMFNFFLVISGVIAAGIGGSFAVWPEISSVLSIVLVIVSSVFWKLDQRVSFFIKRAEHALALAEGDLPDYARLFASEQSATVEAKRDASLWTYGQSFRLIFLLMAAAGLASALVALASESMGTDSSPRPVIEVGVWHLYTHQGATTAENLLLDATGGGPFSALIAYDKSLNNPGEPVVEVHVQHDQEITPLPLGYARRFRANRITIGAHDPPRPGVVAFGALVIGDDSEEADTWLWELPKCQPPCDPVPWTKTFGEARPMLIRNNGGRVTVTLDGHELSLHGERWHSDRARTVKVQCDPPACNRDLAGFLVVGPSNAELRLAPLGLDDPSEFPR